MRIVQVQSNGILFRVLPDTPLKVWIKRTEVTKILSPAAIADIENSLPVRKARTEVILTMPDLDGLMRQAKATNESLALAAGYDRNTVARARGGEKVFANTAETLYQTLKEKTFSYKRRGRASHVEIGM